MITVPDSVVMEASRAYVKSDRSMRAAIIAGLEAWIASGGAKHGRGYLFALDRDDWQADTDMGPTDGDEFPVLIIKQEHGNG